MPGCGGGGLRQRLPQGPKFTSLQALGRNLETSKNCVTRKYFNFSAIPLNLNRIIYSHSTVAVFCHMFRFRLLPHCKTGSRQWQSSLPACISGLHLLPLYHRDHYKVGSPQAGILWMARTCHNGASAPDKTSAEASRRRILSLSIFSLMPRGSRWKPREQLKPVCLFRIH